MALFRSVAEKSTERNGILLGTTTEKMFLKGIGVFMQETAAAVNSSSKSDMRILTSHADTPKESVMQTIFDSVDESRQESNALLTGPIYQFHASDSSDSLLSSSKVAAQSHRLLQKSDSELPFGGGTPTKCFSSSDNSPRRLSPSDSPGRRRSRVSSTNDEDSLDSSEGVLRRRSSPLNRTLRNPKDSSNPSRKASYPQINLDLSDLKKVSTTMRPSGGRRSPGSPIQSVTNQYKTTYLSPRLSPERQGMQSSFDGNNLNSSLDIALIASCDSSAAKKHNKHLDECLSRVHSSQNGFAENLHLPKISANTIEKRAMNFFSREIDMLFRYERMTFENFLSGESPRHDEILHIIQCGDILWKEIYPRARFLFDKVRCYLFAEGVKTPWSERLYTSLEKLIALNINPEGKKEKKLADFLKVIDAVQALTAEKKEHGYGVERLKHWILAPLGDHPKAIEEVLQVLRRWGGPSIKDELASKAMEIARQSIKVANISSVKHYWYQNSSICLGIPTQRIAPCQAPIDAISDGHIMRSWLPMGNKRVIFEHVWVNGKKFIHQGYPVGLRPKQIKMLAKDGSSSLSSPHCSRSPSLSPEHSPHVISVESKMLYEELFLRLADKDVDYQTVLMQIDDHPDYQLVAQQVANFMISASDSSVVNECDKGPWMKLMRATTASACWLSDDMMIRLFPRFLELPYWRKFDHDAGLQLHINARSPEDFEVKHVWQMGIGERVYPEDSHSYAVEKISLKNAIVWTLRPTEEGWEGELSIDSFDIMDDTEHWDNLRPQLANPVDLAAENGKFEGITYRTASPITPARKHNVKGRDSTS